MTKKETVIKIDDDEENFRFESNLSVNIDAFLNENLLEDEFFMTDEQLKKIKLIPCLIKCDKCGDEYCAFERESLLVRCVFCNIKCNNSTCEKKHISLKCVQRQLYGLDQLNFFD
jgi:ribosomal protein S27E